MSKLFEWYGKDFAANDVSLLRLLASYLPFTSRLRANLLAARGRLVHGCACCLLYFFTHYFVFYGMLSMITRRTVKIKRCVWFHVYFSADSNVG